MELEAQNGIVVHDDQRDASKVKVQTTSENQYMQLV